MKTEISRDSHQPDKRYSGVYQQQGRMLTDADWNELVDILKHRLNDALKDIVGNNDGPTVGGTPHHRALKIHSDKSIKPGHLYVDGIAASVKADATAISVTAQDDFPGAPDFSSDCKIYADVWERTVTPLMDDHLIDRGLHGADTSTRKEVLTQIKWCPAGKDPEDTSDNPSKGNAPATVTLLQKTFIPDLCDPCVDQFDVESRIGNYLFRVEVHDVSGGNTPESLNREIILKWSVENGAIQCGVATTEPPEHFTAETWAYEFFDDTSEKHLGVHLSDDGWQPVRGILKATYDKPTGADEPKDFVRRWDGFCTLTKSPDPEEASGFKWEASDDDFDKDQIDSISFTGETVAISLDARKIKIELDKIFVAGDYWLAEVREAQHSANEEIITNALPNGIEHNYLQLGEIKGGSLEDNLEADRKFAFPSLTEMTRMFIAGGDGQEIVPGEPLKPLPQSLKVAVANGEWPVEGAKVRFSIEDGGGTLDPATGIVGTGSDGIAECVWTPGNINISSPGIKPVYEVKVTLVDPEDNSIDLDHPPVYFHANLLSADQIAYEKGCADSGENTVHSHLATDANVSLDLGGDGYYTVKEVLDALLCGLKADHVPYDAPTCAAEAEGDPSVKSLLVDFDIDDDSHLTVKDVLDTLLCELKAAHIPFYPDDCAVADWTPTVKTGLGISDNTNVHDVLQKLICQLDASKIPYNPTGKGTRWEDINEEADTGILKPQTVQNAIDNIVDNLESTDIRYEVPGCDGVSPTVRSLLTDISGKADGETIKIDYLLDRLLCKFKATHLPIDRNNLCPKLSALSGDEHVATVQDAINALCRVEHGGGCCSITLSPGEDIVDRLTNEIGQGADAHICFTVGEYVITEPVLLENLGNITVQGAGEGTLVRSVNSEAAIIFSDCKSVAVRGLTMHSYKLGSQPNTQFDHLNGTLTVKNTGDVIVEDVTLRCPHGGGKMASCLTVANTSQTSSARVRDCHLSPGHQQVGMLLVNVNEARVEDNSVKVRPHIKKSSLKKRIKDKKYRLSIRKMMMTDITVVPKGTPADAERNVEFAYEGKLLRFKTPEVLKDPWQAYLSDLSMMTSLNDRDLMRYVKEEIGKSLLVLATEAFSPADAIAGFKEWFDDIKSHLPAIASQGIVVAGRVANDICITKNSIHGVDQGIHIGVSHNDPLRNTPDFAGRLLVEGNHVENYLSLQRLGERHGIFIGNFDCLHIKNNHLRLRRFPYTLDNPIHGIKIYGYLGRMIQVRGNHLNDYSPGIVARAINPPGDEPLWQIENNLLNGANVATDLDPAAKFKTDNNLI